MKRLEQLAERQREGIMKRMAEERIKKQEIVWEWAHDPARADCQCDFCLGKLNTHILDSLDSWSKRKAKRKKHKALNIKVEVVEDDD